MGAFKGWHRAPARARTARPPFTLVLGADGPQLAYEILGSAGVGPIETLDLSVAAAPRRDIPSPHDPSATYLATASDAITGAPVHDADGPSAATTEVPA